MLRKSTQNFVEHKAKLLLGVPVADGILQEVQAGVARLKGRSPYVVFLRVGEDGASITYVQQKAKKAAFVGMRSETKVFPDSIAEADLVREIQCLNGDSTVDGILLQAPLPPHLDFVKMVNKIDPKKDVDGLSSYHFGRLWQNQDALIPCTPGGIMALLRYYGITVQGKHVVIVNSSLIVGKPLCALLIQQKATVTLCNTYTNDLASITQQADILVLACGCPHAFGKKFVKQGAVVIDVGTTRIPANNDHGYVLQGDADFDALQDHVQAITPVPGGVGPLTVASVIHNTLKAYYLCHPQ